VFAIRREFDLSGRQFDTLIRRGLQHLIAGPEQVISVPFDNLFQIGVSQNEQFIAIAGRAQVAVAPNDRRDGIYLFNRNTGDVKYLAQYDSRSESVGSLSVSDRGDLLVFEEKGTVLLFGGSDGQLTLIDHHPGRLPTLLPDGSGYIFSYRGRLILTNDVTKRQLFSVPSVVGAIRVSPDSQFVAFGVDLSGDLSSTQLRICEVKTLTCVEGPKYSDWIAGRETFWMIQ
jgi:WD40 repeat protein